MSRRRGEFEHRTSIFEGAFRAWSYLGGLEPDQLDRAVEIDPVGFPLANDKRKTNTTNDRLVDQNGEKRREYPYEPLPRSGLAHPYVQAILSPWLGPDVEQDAIQLGLTTLRTWWQHRRKGESGSAVTSLGTERMKGVVDGYTRHFFTLAVCLVTNDGEQPPRTLMMKVKEIEKTKNKKNKKRAREEEAAKLAALALNAGLTHGLGAMSGPGMPDSTSVSSSISSINCQMPGVGLVAAGGAAGGSENSSASGEIPKSNPLERLHAAQRRKLSGIGNMNIANKSRLELQNGSSQAQVLRDMNIIDMKGKCTGNVNIPDIVDKVSVYATQSAHRGRVDPTAILNNATTQSSLLLQTNKSSVSSYHNQRKPSQSEVLNNIKFVSSSSRKSTTTDAQAYHGDPTTTPVVLVTPKGDCLISMSVEGITCAHCITIVEAVLKGCNGRKSPIEGLEDCAADLKLKRILIKIDKSSNAKRISFEASRNLAMVGYTAHAKEMSVYRTNQDNMRIKLDLETLFSAFLARQMADAGCDFNWNHVCHCPHSGVIRDTCPRHVQINSRLFEAFDVREEQINQYLNETNEGSMQQLNSSKGTSGASRRRSEVARRQSGGTANGNGTFSGRNSYKRLSTTSAISFGRAMSSLSALSIDWENMEDFDVNVDHSAHINANGNPNAPIQPANGGTRVSDDVAEGIMEGCGMLTGGACTCGPTCICVGCPIHDVEAQTIHQPPPLHTGRRQHRSSLRIKNPPIDPEVAQNLQVSFQV